MAEVTGPRIMMPSIRACPPMDVFFSLNRLYFLSWYLGAG